MTELLVVLTTVVLIGKVFVHARAGGAAGDRSRGLRAHGQAGRAGVQLAQRERAAGQRADPGELFRALLALRLANEYSHKCKALVGSVIKRLLARIGPKAANQLIGCVKGWLDADGLPLIRMLVAPKRRRISSSSSSSS